MQRAATVDVHQLDAPADAEHGNVGIQGGRHQSQLEFVALRFGCQQVGVGVGTKVKRVDVGAPGKHKPVEPLANHCGISVDGQMNGDASGFDHAAGVVGQVQVDGPFGHGVGKAADLRGALAPTGQSDQGGLLRQGVVCFLRLSL